MGLDIDMAMDRVVTVVGMVVEEEWVADLAIEGG